MSTGDLAERIGAFDSGDQLEAALALPDHLRDALWRVSSAKLGPIPSSGLIVCGMGGSAIGGDLAAAALGSRLNKPLDVVRGYGVPSWTPPDRAIFCSSYSGNTEETIACYDAAEAVGARRVVATTGGKIAELARRDKVPVIGMPAGLQPRAAVGYTFAIAAEVAALVGAGPAIRMEIDSSAAHLEAAKDSLLRTAAELADRIHGSVPLLYGGGLTVPDRLPVEVPDQRERQAPRLHPPPAGDGPQRDRRLGRGIRRAPTPRSSSRIATSTRASASVSSSRPSWSAIGPTT